MKAQRPTNTSKARVNLGPEYCKEKREKHGGSIKVGVPVLTALSQPARTSVRNRARD